MDREFEPVPVRQVGLGGRTSLAGVAAVLLMLVVVAVAATAPPQNTLTVPTASATTLVAATPPVSSPPHSIVVDANTFAAGLAMGRFDSSTVLVRSEIKPGRPPAVPACYDEGRCYAGVLDTEPPVSVEIPYVAADPDDGGVLLHDAQAAWPWWRVVGAPQRGVLALSVSSAGAVKFVGTVRDGSVDRTVADLDDVDLDSFPLDEVVVLYGWLSAPDVAICSRPFAAGPDIGGLPIRPCASDRLHQTEPVQPETVCESAAPSPGQGVRECATRVVSGPSLAVQEGAYERFGAANGSVPAKPTFGQYALARRLYGSGCEGAPPCWGWQIVGRIDGPQVGEVAAISPSPSAGARTPTAAPTFSQTNSAVQGDFALTLSVAQANPAAGEPIKLDATLEYKGAAPVTITGDSDLFAFAFDQLDGGLQMLPASRLTCGTFELQPGQPLARTYGYGGIYLIEGEKVDFNRLFPGVSGLRLPAGTYQLSVTAGFVVGADCYSADDYQTLQTSIVIRVH